jgi:iron complex transport system ATP-binding protein
MKDSKITAQDAQPIIEVDRIGFRRADIDILKDVSWRILPRQHWAVLGPNGSGKTTLLRMTCGYLWPMDGVVRRMGEELVDLRILRRSIGWVANDLAEKIPPQDTVLQTVVSGKYAQIGFFHSDDGSSQDADFTEAQGILNAMHCGHLSSRFFASLSQGERQQVLIARARMVDPLLIILDEPCSGMDPGVRERFLAWLDQLAADHDGPSLVLVTHHVEEIMSSFESTLVLKSGRVFACGRTAEVVNEELLSALYDIRIHTLERRNGRLWPIWARSSDS